MTAKASRAQIIAQLTEARNAKEHARKRGDRPALISFQREEGRLYQLLHSKKVVTTR